MAGCAKHYCEEGNPKETEENLTEKREELDESFQERPDLNLPGQFIYNDILFLPVFPREVLDQAKDFQFHPHDVLVATYPKSGTAWTQEMVWLVMNHTNLERASAQPILSRTYSLQAHFPWSPVSDIDRAKTAVPPRVFRTHLPPRFFSSEIQKKKVKIVVTMRNVKDVLTSYFHYYKGLPALGNFQGSWEDFLWLFKKKRLLFGDWADLNLAWWRLRGEENILIIKYGEMKRDPVKVVKKIAKFLKKDVTEEQVQKIVYHTRFDRMRENKATEWFAYEGYYRKGIVGDWRSMFTLEQAENVDEYVKITTEAEGLSFDADF